MLSSFFIDLFDFFLFILYFILEHTRSLLYWHMNHPWLMILSKACQQPLWHYLCNLQLYPLYLTVTTQSLFAEFCFWPFQGLASILEHIVFCLLCSYSGAYHILICSLGESTPILEVSSQSSVWAVDAAILLVGSAIWTYILIILNIFKR
jgi:hypothetical protein